MKFSVSQVKTFTGSKSKWAGSYILGIKDDYANDNFIVGNLFESRLITGKDNVEEIIGDKQVENLEKVMEDYETLKYNAQGLEFDKGVQQYKVSGNLLGQEWEGYIDNLTEDYIDDIKTAYYLTDINSKIKNNWSGMTSYEEYEFQMRVYMKLHNRKKSRILEVSKFRYKDGRHAHQIIPFYMSDEFDKKMTDKFQPIIDEMSTLFKKYKVGEAN